MKIVSQLSNATPDVASKSAPVVPSTNSFQSAFASAIGASTPAASKDIAPKQGKAQVLDTKKTSSSDGKKKSASDGRTNGTGVPLDTSQPQLMAGLPLVNPESPVQARDSKESIATAVQLSVQPVLPGILTGARQGDAATQAADKTAQGVPAEFVAPGIPASTSAESLPSKAPVVDLNAPSAQAKQGDASAINHLSDLNATVVNTGHDAAASKASSVKASSLANNNLSTVGAEIQKGNGSVTDATSAASLPTPVGVTENIQQQASVVKSATSPTVPSPLNAKAPAAHGDISTAAGQSQNGVTTHTGVDQARTPAMAVANQNGVPPQTAVNQAGNLAQAGTNQGGGTSLPAGVNRVDGSPSAGVKQVGTPAKGKPTTNGTATAPDGTQAAAGPNSDLLKAQVEASQHTGNGSSGNSGDMSQAQALAQSSQAAHTTGATAFAQVQDKATQITGGATNAGLPPAANSIENMKTAQAMNSAQLIQSVHGSEMRLGMQSAEFGKISINTSLNHQSLSAQISIDHNELGHALAAHLPAIEEKLGSAYGVQAKVELRDTGSHSSFNDSTSRESKGNRQQHAGGGATSTAVLQSSITALTSSHYTSTAANLSRLDIRI